MSHVEYILNSIAWSLAGVLATLTYQQLIQWSRRRKGRPEFIKVTPMGFVGAFVMLMTIITFLFYTSSDLRQRQINKELRTSYDCVYNLQQQNAKVENERGSLNGDLQTKSQAIIDVLYHAIFPPLDPNVKQDFATAIKNEEAASMKFNKYKATHPIVSASTCPAPPKGSSATAQGK